MGFIFKFRFYYPNGDNFDNNIVRRSNLTLRSLKLYCIAQKSPNFGLIFAGVLTVIGHFLLKLIINITFISVDLTDPSMKPSRNEEKAKVELALIEL